MANSIQTVLFDLDGTLIDHFTTIYRCYRYAQDTLGLEPATYESVRATVGGSVIITMTRLVGEEHAARAVMLFREHFDKIWREDLVALPGSKEILEALHAQGKKLAIFTNKHGPAAREISDELGYTPFLDLVIGTHDTPWRKPEPEFTQHVMQEMKADAARTLMVGDSPWDIAAATAGDLPCAVVATGSHSLEELRANDPAPVAAYLDLYALGRETFGLHDFADAPVANESL